MRGTPVGAEKADHQIGSSPRRAGNTAQSFFAPRRRWPVHPRACGEHAAFYRRSSWFIRFILRPCGEHASTSPEQMVSAAGSSPRVRGTFHVFRYAHGKPVHPHACREHMKWTPVGQMRRGSSPRAGNTCGRPIRSCKRPVHPRVRGTQPDDPAHSLNRRFIPALRGNLEQVASGGQCPDGFIPAHCGEHASTAETIGSSSGSSPRVRGTRPDARDQRRRQRFIPAHCGEHVAGRRRHAFTHGSSPHAEARKLPKNRVPTIGSSPRVRGTRQIRKRGSSPWRFIPACGEHVLKIPRSNVSAG